MIPPNLPPELRAEIGRLIDEGKEVTPEFIRDLTIAHREARKKAGLPREAQRMDPRKKFTHIRPFTHRTEIPILSEAEFTIDPHEAGMKVKKLYRLEDKAAAEFAKKREALRRRHGF